MSATDLSPLSAGSFGPSSPEATFALRPAERFRSRDLKPPRGVYIPKGPIVNPRFGGAPQSPSGHTAAQKAGLRYEQKVHDVLSAIYEANYRLSPSLLFEDRRGLHRCIPDGVLELPSAFVIVEIKLTHTERAWWQLSKLYRPVLQAILNTSKPLLRAEICHSYDPAVKFPERHDLVSSLHKLPSDRVGVLQWKI